LEYENPLFNGVLGALLQKNAISLKIFAHFAQIYISFEV